MSLTHLKEITVKLQPSERMYKIAFLQDDENPEPVATIKNNGQIEIRGDIVDLKNMETAKIPVVERESGWLKFKRLVWSEYGKKKLYQPIMHPDFDDWKTSRPASANINLLFKIYGDVKGKTVLDIGSCLGFYSHMLASKGAQVTGIDLNPNRITIARALSKLYGFPENNPVFIKTGFANYMLYTQQHFDLVVFVNTIQHVLAQNPVAGWRALILLSEVADAVFLNYGIKRKHDFTPQRFLKRSSFTHMKNLGFSEQAPRGYELRPLYFFWKEKDAGIIEVDVQELWNDTYTQSEKGLRLGNCHLDTVRAFNEDPEISLKQLPLYKYLLSEEYERLSGKTKTRDQVLRYLDRYRQDFKNLKKKGYRPENYSFIKVFVENGKARIRDGNRRLSCIMVLGQQKKIRVQIVDKMWKRTSKKPMSRVHLNI